MALQIEIDGQVFEFEDVSSRELVEAEVGRRQEYLKLPEGRTTIRILPAPKGGKAVVGVKMHSIWPPAVQRPVKLACAREHGWGTCPVCVLGDKFGSVQPEVEGISFGTRLRFFANVIKPNESPTTVYRWEFGWKIFSDIRAYLESYDGASLAHPLQGRNIDIIRRGSGKHSTEYSVVVKEPSPLPDLTVLKDLPDLMGLLRPLNREDYKRLFLRGMGYDTEETAPAALLGMTPEALLASIAFPSQQIAITAPESSTVLNALQEPAAAPEDSVVVADDDVPF